MKIEALTAPSRRQAAPEELDYIGQFLPDRCEEYFTDDLEVEDYLYPSNLFCLTLYNEPIERFAESLCSILAGLAHADLAATSVIAVIIDGIDQVDPAVLAMLGQAGCLDGGRMPLGQDCAFFYSNPPAASFGRVTNEASPDATDRCRFVVAVKGRNRGKLHSHALFFGSLCPKLMPVYCHQLDTGTLVARTTIARLVQRMDADPALGALAPRILTPEPGDGGLLKAWQYWDFVVSRAFVWPSEIATGHLSVIPGQYCVLRWRALRARSRVEDHSDSSDTGGAVTADEPVSAYLRGLEARKPLDRVMYLAEDRVLGNEIALHHRGAWRLGYDPAALATTDACDSLPELLRQRRRWTNSALVARLTLLKRSAGLFAQPDCPPRERLRIATRSLWQVNLALLEFAAPALLLCCLFEMLHAFYRVTLFLPLPWRPLATALALAGLAPIALPIERLPASVRAPLARLRNFAACALTLGVGSLLLLSGVWVRSLLLLSILAISATTLLPFLGRRSVGQLRTLPVYLLVGPFVSTLILIYALGNMHDVSWGTKGLSAPSPSEKREARGLARLRAAAIALWLILNLGTAALGIIPAVPTEIAGTFNISNIGFGIELVELLTLVTVAALFFHARPSRSRTGSAPRPNVALAS